MRRERDPLDERPSAAGEASARSSLAENAAGRLEASALVERVEAVLRQHRCAENVGRRRRLRRQRPCVTLAFAQSLDGCIAAGEGAPTAISNSHTQTLTHRLRAIHDAILVGVNTVLVDDPQLNVRRVEGRDPRPIVLDSMLRMPLEARIMRRTGASVLIATAMEACAKKEALLEAAGAEVLRIAPGPEQDRSRGLDLADLLERLFERGIRSVMVEGGARVITSVLARNLADQLFLTISPRFFGGVHAVECAAGVDLSTSSRLCEVRCATLEDDLIVHGTFG